MNTQHDLSKRNGHGGTYTFEDSEFDCVGMKLNSFRVSDTAVFAVFCRQTKLAHPNDPRSTNFVTVPRFDWLL